MSTGNDKSSKDIISSLKSFKEFFEVIAGAVIALGVIVTTLRNLPDTLRGSARIITVIVLIVACFLWLIAIYIYRKKDIPQKQPGFQQQSSFRKPAYSNVARYSALVGIIAIPIITFAGLVYLNRSPERIIILIADFQGEDQNYGVTETVIEQLRNSTSEYSDVEIQTLRRVITVQEGSEVARSIGKDFKASIVLWGWYRKTQEKILIITHFEVLRKPHNLILLKEKRVLDLPAKELDSFNIQTQLSGEMSYLTLLITGLTRFEATDYDGAIDRFSKSIAQPALPNEILNPADIYFYRGLAYSYKKSYEQAIADLNQVINLRQDYSEAYFHRGINFLSMDKLEQAISDFDKYISLKPNEAGAAYLGRGWAYLGKGDLDKAISDFDKSVAINPNIASSYFNRGLAYQRKGEIDQAISDFSKSIEIDPQMRNAHLLRATAYLTKNEIDQAITDYNKAIELSPDDFASFFGRGKANLMKGNVDQALADLNRTIELKHNEAGAYSTRGQAFLQKGNLDKAIADLTQAILLDSHFSESYFYRGHAYLFKGELDLALGDFSQAIELKPEDGLNYIARGTVYKRKGEKDYAINDYRKGLQLTNNLINQPELQSRIEKELKELGAR